MTTTTQQIRVSDRLFDLVMQSTWRHGYIELYIPMPAECHDDSAMDRWVAEHLDARGLSICGCIPARVDIDRQGNQCRMNRGVRTQRCIRVSLCRPENMATVVEGQLIGKELVC